MDCKPGEVYSANWEDDGSFRVVKVLEVDEKGIHIRVYAERFAERPSLADLGELTLGSVFDGDAARERDGPGVPPEPSRVRPTAYATSPSSSARSR